MTAGSPSGPRVAIVADDLIWATRLADGVRAAGAIPVPVRSAGALDAALAGAEGAVVDLTSRAYDGLAALGARHGRRGAGDRRRASTTTSRCGVRHARRGPRRCTPTGSLFEHGDRELGAWVASLPARAASGATR